MRERVFDSVGLVTMRLTHSLMESGKWSLKDARDHLMSTVHQQGAYLAMEADHVVECMERSANVDVLSIDAPDDLRALVVVPMDFFRDGSGTAQDALSRCSAHVRDTLDGHAPLKPEILFERAQAIGAKGRLDEALELCEQLVAQEPTGNAVIVKAKLQGIRLLCQAGELEEATKRVEQALGDHTEAAGELWFWRGRLAEQRGQTQQAQQDYEQALTHNAPNQIDIYLALANVHAGLGDHQAAVDRCTDGLAATPQDAALLAERGHHRSKWGDHEAAIADLDEAMRLAPDDLRNLHDRAVCYMAAQENNKALLDLDKVLAVDQDHDLALQNRGIVHERLGQLERAQADFDEAYTLNDQRLFSLLGRARMRVERAAHEQALLDLDELLKHVPKEAKAYALRAQCHEGLGRNALAVRDYVHVLRYSLEAQQQTRDAEQALERLGYRGPRTYPLPKSPHLMAVEEHGSPPAQQLLDEANTMCISDPQRALETYDLLIHDHPEFFAGYLHRAALYTHHRVLDKGGADLDAAAKLGPKTDLYHQVQAQLLVTQGQLEEALLAYSEAVALWDLDPVVRLGKAMVLQQLDRCEEAATELNKALELNPANEDVLFTLAGTYTLMGDIKESIATYDRLLRLSTDDAQALANRGASKIAIGDAQGAISDWPS